MTAKARIATIAALALVGGCGYSPPPVAVSGPVAELAGLNGEWWGEYRMQSPGSRTGSILFRLDAAADSATGDVMMTYDTEGRPAVIASDADPWRQPVPRSKQLRITFVRTSGGTVSGAIEPYADPQCGCLLNTTFIGRVEGDRVSGTWRSVAEGESAVHGHGVWSAERRPG